jgi:hypothetical protein
MRPHVEKRMLKSLIVIGCVLLGVCLYRVFGKAVRYEIPVGFHGWLRVNWSQPSCPPLGRQALFLVVRIPPSGQFCTSNAPSANFSYQKFESLSLDGVRRPLRWNAPRKPGIQVWDLGIDVESKSEIMFVGEEHEDWNRFPKPAQFNGASAR